jgi:segregation and condensation protein B
VSAKRRNRLDPAPENEGDAEIAAPAGAEGHRLSEVMQELEEAARDRVTTGGEEPAPAQDSAPVEPLENLESLEDEGDLDELEALAAEEGAELCDPDIPEGSSLEAALESLLLVANEPLELKDFTALLGGCSWVPVRRGLRALKKRYDERQAGLELIEVAKGWRLTTRPLFSGLCERLSVIEREERVTRAQLEVLAIIAYRQPVKRSDIDTIRGADSSGSLRQVIDKGLVRVVGRADQLGRPFLYGTSRRFLERFGLKNLKKLPKPTGLGSA